MVALRHYSGEKSFANLPAQGYTRRLALNPSPPTRLRELDFKEAPDPSAWSLRVILADALMRMARTLLARSFPGAGLLRLALAALAFLGLGSGQTLGAATATPDPEYLFTTWDTDNGLPQSSATAITQTLDGYLWFGTFRGLVRFDGERFTVYNPVNTPDLPGPQVINLYLDRRHRLWVSTDAGMACVRDGKWQVFTPGHGWAGNYVRWFAESADGRLCVTTFDGKLLREGAGGFEQVPPPPTDPNSGLFPHLDEQGTLSVLGPSFVGRFVNGRWVASDLVRTWAREALLGAGSSRDGGIWVVTRDHIRKYRGGRQVLERPGPGKHFRVWQIYEDSAGAVWLCSMDQGLYRFTPDGGWRHLTKESGLAHNAIRCIFEDRERNLWVGTDGGGLQRLRPRIFRNWGTEQGMPEPEVASVATDRHGRIFIGTPTQGVQRLQAGTIRPVLRPGSAESITPTPVLALLADSRGRMWVGTSEDGLYQIEGARCRHLGANDFGLAGRRLQIYTLLEDSRGRIWIGSSPELFCFDGGKVQAYRPDQPGNLADIDALAEDPRTGAIWVAGSSSHLYRWINGRLAVVSPGVDLPQPQDVRFLHIDPDGTVWAATSESGLVWWREGRWGTIAEKQGLPAHNLGAILDDGQGHFWIASDKGILRVQHDELEAVLQGQAVTLSCQVYGKSDGLLTPRCSMGRQGTGVKDRAGRLWFATHKGLALVDPVHLRTNKLPPPLRIQEVLIDGALVGREEPFWTSEAAALAPVVVPAGARRVEIHYEGLCLSAPEKVRYRYLLEGLDPDWVDVGGRHEVYLQDLKSGHYRFRVRAANNDGLWDEAGSAIEFDVEPHFYQTWWFYGACVVAWALAVLAGHAWRVRRLKARERELAQRVEERTESLRLTANKLRDAKEAAEAALARVKQLQGLLPICCYCKRVRDDQNYWQQVEAYISSHSEAQFSHGICPECYQKEYGRIQDLDEDVPPSPQP